MNDRSDHDGFDRSRLPRRSGWLFNRFARYVQWYLGRHFDAVRLLAGGRDRLASLPADRPLILYSNHPSWWDPLIATAVAAACLGGRRTYAPIEAAMLEKYKVFGRLGFFGIASDSRRGGAAFLRTGDAVLLEPTQQRDEPRNAIWITAEGFFSDPRHRPVVLRPAWPTSPRVGPKRSSCPWRWSTRSGPSGSPRRWWRWARRSIRERSTSKAWRPSTHASPRRCRSRWTRWPGPAIAKNPDAFETLIAGRSGIGGVYDWVRLLGAWARGRRFDSRHLPERRHAH